MKLPKFLQRFADRFNAETDTGMVHGWHAANSPAGGRGPGSPRQVARGWLDAAGQRLDELLAQDRARRAPAGGLRRLGRMALAPARGYVATTLAFGYATAETVGWYDGHRARAGAAAGPRPHPRFTGAGSGPGHAGGYTAGAYGPQASYGPQAGYGASRAAGRSRMAAASGTGRPGGRGSGASNTGLPAASTTALSGLSYATPASVAPGSPPATPAAISLPAAPARRAITGGRAR